MRLPLRKKRCAGARKARHHGACGYACSLRYFAIGQSVEFAQDDGFTELRRQAGDEPADQRALLKVDQRVVGKRLRLLPALLRE